MTRKIQTEGQVASVEQWVEHWPTRHCVPAFNQTLWRNVDTFGADGSVRRSIVSPLGHMAVFIPGFLENHVYKVTVVTTEVDDSWGIGNDLDSQLYGLITGVGTYEFIARVQEGNRLRFTGLGTPPSALTISSLTVEPMDGINPTIFPTP